MNNELNTLLENNKSWASSVEDANPGFFEKLAQGQQPKYLWIGCSDSRVPPNQVLGLEPGEIFVHRNVANQVLANDNNCMSAVDYSVQALKVEHILIAGHYGCGGIQASTGEAGLDIVDSWLGCAKDNFHLYKDSIKHHDDATQLEILVELNAVHQVRNLSRTSTIKKAWANGQKLTINAMVFKLSTGEIKDLGYTVSSSESTEEEFKATVQKLINR
jgi:carbonic anhydrase